MADKGDEKKMSLGKNLKRKLNGMNATQKDLAEFCCVSQVMVSKTITGIITPSVPLLVRMAEFCGCTVDELVKDE